MTIVTDHVTLVQATTDIKKLELSSELFAEDQNSVQFDIHTVGIVLYVFRDEFQFKVKFIFSFLRSDRYKTLQDRNNFPQANQLLTSNFALVVHFPVSEYCTSIGGILGFCRIHRDLSIPNLHYNTLKKVNCFVFYMFLTSDTIVFQHARYQRVSDQLSFP